MTAAAVAEWRNYEVEDESQLYDRAKKAFKSSTELALTEFNSILKTWPNNHTTSQYQT